MISEQDTSPTVERDPDTAAALSALANPVRLRIIGDLFGRREYVSELARRLQIGRPLLHMHLRRLEEAGLVRSSLELSAQGKAMRFYEVAPFDIRLTPETVARAGHLIASDVVADASTETDAETGAR